MSHNLWRYLLEDDVDSFRQYLANATFSSAPGKVNTISGSFGSHSFKIGSPGQLATSPKTPIKTRKSSGNIHTTPNAQRGGVTILNRSDVNGKDTFGRTILHHAASSHNDNASEFVKALLEIPFLDLYSQDNESGWTPLHRALYFGNVSIAQSLMRRDIQDATDYTTHAAHTQAGGLVKIKDHEGNSPFEIFGLTIAPRILQTDLNHTSINGRDDESSNSVDFNMDENDHDKQRRHIRPVTDLGGDEVFAFGSNKNFSLGLGDEDDRHFPERLQLTRPDHLMQRLLEDRNNEKKSANMQEEEMSKSWYSSYTHDLPTLIRHQSFVIQDVVMSKLHTAVLTTDPISNLYVCGFGPGGRLGTGDENTAFSFKCVQSGGLAKRQIAAIALGQDHSVAISSQGEVFTWGSNRYGQLGYALPETSSQDVPIQVTPRQLYGNIKKELIVGAAASSTHSAIFTSSALYTFGKNSGQLGLTDADARSFEMQTIPRRVGVSVLQVGIQSVSTIDCATTVLLENHDVIVFTNYGWTRVLFQLEAFTGTFASNIFSVQKHPEGNWIQKITSAGNTICAVSTFGEVFTVEVSGTSDGVPASVSTTNPTKARNALPPPTRIWSIKKAHMSAIDAAVGQDGSIILCTSSGSVWRKEKRANFQQNKGKDSAVGKGKDYKFVRIPNLTRAIAVRSNAFGAFTAVRKDCDVMREQITIDPPTLWEDFFGLLPFRQYEKQDGNGRSRSPGLRFWTPATKGPSPASIKRNIITNPAVEGEFGTLMKRYEPLSNTGYDIWITSNVTEVRIPVHSFLIKARSSILRAALVEFQEKYYYSIPDVVSIEYGQDGQIKVQLQGADFFTLTNFVFYLYTDNLIDVWHFASKTPHLAARYRSVRTELLKLANHFELRQMEKAVRVMIDPIKSLHYDVESAFLDQTFFTDADVLIELADGVSLPAHSVLLRHRCPFFEGLFNGHAGGIWMSSRRNLDEEKTDPMKVDLKHIERKAFEMVLRHLYADTGDELFDDVVTTTLEEFIDLVLDVLSVANELMIDRLAQICQKVLGKFVTTRNVCQLLNTVAECSVNEFKYAALEYICLNLESMLELRILEELDKDLLAELDVTVQENQKAYMPYARSGRAEAELFDNNPDLIDRIEWAKQRRIDSMRLRSRLIEDEEKFSSSMKFKVGSLDSQSRSMRHQRDKPISPSTGPSPMQSPTIIANNTNDDLPFDMDDESSLVNTVSVEDLPSPSLDIDDSPKVPNISGKAQTSSEPGTSQRTQDPITTSLGKVSLNETTTSPVIRVHGFDTPRAAWQSVPQNIHRPNLKDILEHASDQRVSGLTQAMNKAGGPSSKPTGRVSQKERKRQQQEKQEPTKEQISDSKIFTGSPSSSSKSPWQMLAAERKLSATSEPSNVESRTPERPNMTMRQTVAGSKPSQPNTPPQIHRNVSSATSATNSQSVPPQIRSIRHTPLPTRSNPDVNAYTSMAEIVAQQQTEKIAIKEAATAKNSLNDIQQEQEFQAWWDSETKRVQEEEAQARAAANRRRSSGKGSSSKSRGHPARKRRGSESASVEKPVGTTPFPSQSPLQQEPRGESGPQRGTGSRSRGRGRGGA